MTPERAPGWRLTPPAGAGRYAEFLAARGHRVIGVDSSPDMLARARERVPGGEFRLGELERLPLPDDSVDVIVFALALTHVQHLEPVLAEFARVLRPGGDLVVSDAHPARGAVGSDAVKGPWTDGRRLMPIAGTSSAITCARRSASACRCGGARNCTAAGSPASRGQRSRCPSPTLSPTPATGRTGRGR